jgi:hypothetical protein
METHVGWHGAEAMSVGNCDPVSGHSKCKCLLRNTAKNETAGLQAPNDRVREGSRDKIMEALPAYQIIWIYPKAN